MDRLGLPGQDEALETLMHNVNFFLYNAGRQDIHGHIPKSEQVRITVASGMISISYTKIISCFKVSAIPGNLSSSIQ
jgi:hypothetical protein